MTQMTSARLNSAILEILLHIGNSFDAKKVANEALLSYIQQLDLAGTVLYEEVEHRYIINTMKPKNLKNNKEIFETFDDMMYSFDKVKKEYFDKDMPYSTYVNQHFYYIYRLKGFGFLVLIKNDESLSDEILKTIRQVNYKFTNSLIASNTLKELRKQEKLVLHQSRLAQMGEMISLIAHQWRQPLAAISATSNDLAMKVMFDKYDRGYFSKKLDKISKLVQHLSKTIDDFRGFYKEDKEKREITYQELIESALDIISVSLENKNIKLITDFKSDKKLYVYANELRQVILNLLKNAEDILLEKNISNPTIKIEVENNILRVKDNAGGVPKDIVDKIFDPYFSTKTKKDGTGLGLYMSKTIVEEHCGGELRVFNDEEGAVFEIILSIKPLF